MATVLGHIMSKVCSRVEDSSVLTNLKKLLPSWKRMQNNKIVHVLCVLFNDSSSFLFFRLIVMDESSTCEQTLLVTCPRTVANASPGSVNQE